MVLEPAFELVSVQPNVIMPWGQRMIIHIRNPVAMEIQEMKMELAVYAEDDLQKPVLEQTVERAQFAPNTVMPYQLPLSKGLLDDGVYMLHVALTVDEARYEMETTFTADGYELYTLSEAETAEEK